MGQRYRSTSDTSAPNAAVRVRAAARRPGGNWTPRCPHDPELSTFAFAASIGRWARRTIDGMTTAAFCLLIAWCLLLGVIDIHARRLPNALTGTGAAAVFGYAYCAGQLPTALAGAALLTMPYLVTHLISPAALGAGDVKLAVALGAAAALAGPPAWVWAALAAPVLTAAVAVAVLGGDRIRAALGRTARGARIPGRRTVPHGPAMCLATVTAMALA